MNTEDTIVAIGSPPGAARRGIVRLSGPDAFGIAQQNFSGPQVEDDVHLEGTETMRAPEDHAAPKDQAGAEDNASSEDQSEFEGHSAPPPLQGGVRGGLPSTSALGNATNDPTASKTAENNSWSTAKSEHQEISACLDQPHWCEGTVSFDSYRFPCTAAFFPAQKSYTGQPAVEFHLLGAPTLLGWLVETCLAYGARQAGPGEFTARAFMAGRLDIAQVHGVAGLIAANSDGQLRAAERLLHGALSDVAAEAREQLADLISLVEGAMDFADEPIEFITAESLNLRLEQVRQSLEATRTAGVQAERWEVLPRVVLVGKPNAGKSSIFNALLANDRAMATPVAGTTRDSLTARLVLPRGACRLVDVAGWGEAQSAIDASAQVIAEREAADAALRVLVVDLATFDTDALLTTLRRLAAPAIVLGNKTDSVDASVNDQFRSQVNALSKVASNIHVADCITVSAVTHDGIEQVRHVIADVLQATDDHGAQHAIALMAEHRQALDSAVASIARAAEMAAQCDYELDNADLVALEMRAAAEALGQLVGMDQTEETLGRIFSRFCVGK